MFGKLLEYFSFRKKKVSVVCCGLDHSGKTTFLNYFQFQTSGKTSEVTPTIGFNVQKFAHQNLEFTAFDLGGAGRYRTMWSHFYKGCHGIIFVIDSQDTQRIGIAKDELFTLLDNKDLFKVPLLILANKQDLEGTMSSDEISDILVLDQIKDREWNIIPTNALKGEGADKAMQWLGDAMKKYI